MASFKADLKAHSLSRSWAPFRSFGSVCTGGKVVPIPPPDGRAEYAGDAEAGRVPLLPVACKRDDAVVVADLVSGEVWQELAIGEKELASAAGVVARGREEATAFAVHPRGRYVAVAGHAQTLTLWSYTGVPDAEERGESKEAGDALDAAALIGDGTSDVAARRLWSVHRQWKGHKRPVVSMAFDTTGRLLATGGADRVCIVWDVEGGFATHSLKGHAGVVSLVRFHPDPSRAELVTGTDAGDTSLRFWSLRSGKGQCFQHETDAHASSVDEIAFSTTMDSPSEHLVAATVARDQTMVVWSLPARSGEQPSVEWRAVATVALFEQCPTVLAWPWAAEGCRPAGHVGASTFFLTLGRRGLVRLWRVGESLSEVSELGRRGLGEMTASTEWVERSVTARLEHEAEAAEHGRGIGGEHEAVPSERGETASWAWVRDEAGTVVPMLVVGTGDLDLHLLQAGVRGGRARLLTHRGSVLGHCAEVAAMDWVTSPSRRPLLALAGSSTSVHLIDAGASSDRKVRGAVVSTLRGHTETVLSLSTSPDGMFVATASKDGSCRVFDVASGACVGVCEGHTESVTAVSWPQRRGPFEAATTEAAAHSSRPVPASSSAAIWLVTASRDRTLQRWDVAPVVHALGRRVGGGASGVAGWDVAEFTDRVTADPLKLLSCAAVRAHDKEVNGIAVSPNDRLVATAGADKTIRLWDSAFLQSQGTLSGHKRGVWAVAFSPTEQLLASVSGDRTVRVWSISEMRCIRTLEGHTSSVLSVVFVRQGQQLVSGGADGLLKLWSWSNSECVWTGEAHNDRVWAVTVRPTNGDDEESAELVTGAGDGAIRFWRDTTMEETEALTREAEEREQKEGQLFAAMSSRKYDAAAALCLELEKPQQLRAIFEEMLSRGPLGKGTSTGSMTALGSATADWTSRMHAEWVAWQAHNAGQDASSFEGGASSLSAVERGIRECARSEAMVGEDGDAGPAMEEPPVAVPAGLEMEASSWWAQQKGRLLLLSVVGSLTDELLGRLLQWVAQWNTRAVTVPVAQEVFSAALRVVDGKRLLRLGPFGGSARALFLYGGRHTSRCDRLLQSAYVLDSALEAMSGGVGIAASGLESDAQCLASGGRSSWEMERDLWGLEEWERVVLQQRPSKRLLDAEEGQHGSSRAKRAK
jgi:U3 small nucleolar RNA-associated protein 13